MRSDDVSFDQLLEVMLEPDPPRVWSMIISAMGDITTADEPRLPGIVLNQMMGRIGLKPDAIRVALHRLRKDGWIESIRTGRQSDYVFTEFARQETDRASPRIYATTESTSQCWTITTKGGADAGDLAQIAVRVNANFWISGQRPENGTNLLV